MTLEKYFHIVHSLVEHHWAIVEKEIVYKTYYKGGGEINGKITLLGGSYIDFVEEILVTKKAVIKKKYSYQYIKDTRIFRYDNYPKHPGISFPFHHKHTSTGVTSLEAPPKLIDIIEEALRHIL